MNEHNVWSVAMHANTGGGGALLPRTGDRMDVPRDGGASVHPRITTLHMSAAVVSSPPVLHIEYHHR